MLKEQQVMKARLKISRIEPYLNQYALNCNVRGLQEID
jgi:hypothetical protein